MKVLVTGGAGYVGSTACAEILRAGHSVRVFDRLIYGGESLLSLMGHPSFDLVVGDIRDQAALRDALRGCDAVIHLAGIVGEPACSINEEKAWSINASGSRTVVTAARDVGIHRLLYVSTCSNYGVANTAALANEDTPLNPISNYAKAKVEAEQFVLGERGDLAACVFRLGTICGVSPRMRFDLLISDLARLAVYERPIDIFAPEAWRPYLAHS